MWIIDWYVGLPPVLRFLIALIFLGWACVELFLSGVFRVLPWTLGIVFLMFALPSDREKNKWGDW